MFSNENTIIDNVSIHYVGNKSVDEIIRLSSRPIKLEQGISKILTHFFFNQFKDGNSYALSHTDDLKFNEIYTYATEIFNDPNQFHQFSIKIANHLYEKSTHPNIKSGELYVAYFENCEFDGENIDAIGIFKSENKETFLKVYESDREFLIDSQDGVNINKLDKGCLIFNTEKDNGYILSIVDKTNKGTEAFYWTDEFLNVRQRKDEYYNTQNILSLCKNFVTRKLPSEFDVTKADQAEILNKSVKYFKENDNFDLEDFTNEVIQQPEVIDSFSQYKNSFEQDRDLKIADSFTISDSAVKKQSRSFKSVIKLDRNFHIYVHGNNQYLKKGFDESTGMHYYQLFFKEEQ